MKTTAETSAPVAATTPLDGMEKLTQHMRAASTVANCGRWVACSDAYYGGTLRRHGVELEKVARQHGFDAEAVPGMSVTGGLVMRMRKRTGE